MNQFGQEEAEELALHYCRDFGLEEREGLSIESVSIDFEEIDNSMEAICEPTIDDDNILRIRLRDTSLLSGIKLFIARLANDLSSSKDRPVFLEFALGFIYPICMLVISLSMLFLIPITDSIAKIIVGPILFTGLVLPIVFWMERKGRRISNQKKLDIMQRMRSVDIFEPDEVQYYSSRYPTSSTMNTLLLFAVYIIGLLFLIIAIL